MRFSTFTLLAALLALTVSADNWSPDYSSRSEQIDTSSETIVAQGNGYSGTTVHRGSGRRQVLAFQGA
ncbi:MAG: hypothetical protein ACFE0I_16705 [Elainellaceae cyanobacterium]